VLYGSYGHFPPWVLPPAKFDGFIELIQKGWGTGASLATFAPSKVSDERFKRWWSRFERLGASPSAAIALMRMNNEIDIRHVLPSIQVATLVLHRVGDLRVNVEAGRFLGASIPGAKYVELPGDDHVPWAGDADRLADEIEEFLTGARREIEPDRVLATVMSPTSWIRRSGPLSLETAAGEPFSTATTICSGRRSCASEAKR
jgi:pimeloyl-ACP methyl ester carboxylesterase